MPRRGRLDQAILYLEGLIAVAASEGSGRLPTTREVCTRGQFCRQTVHKALRVLAAEKKCVVVPGGGVFVGGAPVAAARRHGDRPGPAPYNWQKVKAAVCAKILAGTYRPDQPFPRCKQLCAEHQASHTTVVTALRSLVGDGMLVERGKSYEPASARCPKSTSTILFIAHGSSMAEMTEFTPRSAEYLRCLETGCMHHGIRVQFASYRDAISRSAEVRRALLSGHQPGSLIGVLVWTLGLNAQDLGLLTNNLLRIGKPVAVLDEIGDVPLPHEMRTNPLFRVFITGYSQRAGLDVGTYLLNRGHCNAAFISVTADSRAYQNRAQGVEARMRSGQPRASLRQIALEEDVSDVEFYARLQSHPVYRKAMETLRVWPVNPYTRRHAILEQNLVLMQTLRSDCSRRILDALTRNGVTVCVACNDLLAFIVLEVLRSQKVDVPGRVSVVGFDDVPDAYVTGLTTYNFNVPAIVDAMVDHVLGGPLARHWRSRRTIEVPGYVVERQTCGRGPGVAQATAGADGAANRTETAN